MLSWQRWVSSKVLSVNASRGRLVPKKKKKRERNPTLTIAVVHNGSDSVSRLREKGVSLTLDNNLLPKEVLKKPGANCSSPGLIVLDEWAGEGCRGAVLWVWLLFGR